MWQTIIVYIIGAVVFGYIVFKICRMITRKSNPCVGCDGCELKSLMQSSRVDFREQQKSCRTDPTQKIQNASPKKPNCCG